MPLYRFACKHYDDITKEICGTHFEMVRSIKEPPPTTCPSCGNESLVVLPPEQTTVFDPKPDDFLGEGYRKLKKKPGDLTKAYIEKLKEEKRQMIEEMKRKRGDD